MKKYFLDLKGFVEHSYPEFQGSISGDVYPPPQYAQYVATITGYLWIIGIAIIVIGPQNLKSFGLPADHEFFRWINENKATAFFGLRVLNNVGNSFLATGAFEVYLGDDLVFSKLQAHHFPSAEEIIGAFASKGFQPVH